MTVVQMDYDQITMSANGYKAAADALRGVAKALEAAIQILRASAFLSFGTTAALAQYLEGIKNALEKVAQVCEKLSKGLMQAMTDHKNGDVTTKGYFNF